MFQAVIILLLSHPQWSVRDWAERGIPWPLIAAAVPNNYPDAEVRLRYRRTVPVWYRELTPWFLDMLVGKRDIETREEKLAFIRVGWRYSKYWVSFDNEDSAAYLVNELRQQSLPERMK